MPVVKMKALVRRASYAGSVADMFEPPPPMMNKSMTPPTLPEEEGEVETLAAEQNRAEERRAAEEQRAHQEQEAQRQIQESVLQLRRRASPEDDPLWSRASTSPRGNRNVSAQRRAAVHASPDHEARSAPAALARRSDDAEFVQAADDIAVAVAAWIHREYCAEPDDAALPHAPGTTAAATALLSSREQLQYQLKSLRVKGRLQAFHDSFGKLIKGEDERTACATCQAASGGTSAPDLRAAVVDMRAIVEKDFAVEQAASSASEEDATNVNARAQEDVQLSALQKRNAELESVCELALKDIGRLSTTVVGELESTKSELAMTQEKLSALVSKEREQGFVRYRISGRRAARRRIGERSERE